MPKATRKMTASTSTKNSDSKINKAITSLENKVAQFEKEISELREEFKKLKEETADIERKDRLKDVIVRGIPYRRNENTLKLAHIIAAKLEHHTSLHIEAFRLGDRIIGEDSPIVIRLSNHAEQRALLSAFRIKKGLTLAQLGCDQLSAADTNPSSSTDTGTGSSKSSQIEMSESLTRENNTLLRHAIRLREEGLLYSVNTRNGYVYVKRTEIDAESKFVSTESLT